MSKMFQNSGYDATEHYEPDGGAEVTSEPASLQDPHNLSNRLRHQHSLRFCVKPTTQLSKLSKTFS